MRASSSITPTPRASVVAAKVSVSDRFDIHDVQPVELVENDQFNNTRLSEFGGGENVCV
ncbi:hypothetical protein GCM10009412_14800 [Aeromonas salmonicida subsp. achromogenes]